MTLFTVQFNVASKIGVHFGQEIDQSTRINFSQIIQGIVATKKLQNRIIPVTIPNYKDSELSLREVAVDEAPLLKKVSVRNQNEP